MPWMLRHIITLGFAGCFRQILLTPLATLLLTPLLILIHIDIEPLRLLRRLFSLIFTSYVTLRYAITLSYHWHYGYYYYWLLLMITPLRYYAIGLLVIDDIGHYYAYGHYWPLAITLMPLRHYWPLLLPSWPLAITVTRY